MTATTAVVPMMSCKENGKQSGVSFSGGIPPCSGLVSVFLTHAHTYSTTYSIVQLFTLTNACNNICLIYLVCIVILWIQLFYFYPTSLLFFPLVRYDTDTAVQKGVCV